MPIVTSSRQFNAWYAQQRRKSRLNPIAQALTPLSASNVIFSGSSLTERATNTTPKLNRINEVATHLGYTGSIVNVGVGGNSIAQNGAYWISSVRGQAYATASSVCVMVTNGNDVSSRRPYATDTYSNTGTSSQLAIDWQNRFDAASADVGLVIPTTCSLRTYTTAPIVDPNNLAGTQDNGSYPYNLNIFNPLISTNTPEFYNSATSRGKLDNYDFIEKSFWSVSDNDGVHMVTSIDYCFLEKLLLDTKRIYDTSTAVVSGKTVIVYPQNPTDALNTATGYTPLILVNSKVIDTTNSPMPHLSVEFNGGTIPTLNGAGATGNARVADSDLHGALLLDNTLFASGAGNLSNSRAPTASVILRGLAAGTTGTITMAACRDSSNAIDRQGDMTLNGVASGIHDAANNVASNQFGPIAFTADSNGVVELKTTPTLNADFSYIGAVKYVFD